MIILKNCRFVPFLTEDIGFDMGDVLVKDGKIADIKPCGAAFEADGAEIMDLGGKYLLPGLIDMHIHLCFASDAEIYQENIPDAQRAITVIRFADCMLNAGYTTIRDAGDALSMPVVYVRNAIDKGELKGPTIKTSGPIIQASWMNGTSLGYYVDGPFEFRKATRKTFANGADYIKLYGSGSLLVPTNIPGYPIIEEEEIKEAVNIAKRNGSYVAIHAHGAEAIDTAARCGVHTIEHASLIREDTLDYIESLPYGEVGLVPTFYALHHIFDEPESYNAKRAEKLIPQMKESLGSAAHNHNILIGWGTDVTFNVYEKNPMEEFRLRKEMFGYTNEQILKQATINSAKLMYLDDEIGSVKIGKTADLIVVDGDPAADISVMYKVPEHVIKKGELVR